MQKTYIEQVNIKQKTKKLLTIAGSLLIASLVLTSCTSELESDIKKAFELKCVMDGANTTRSVAT